MGNVIYYISEPKVSPATFCRVFPFHIMFDRGLRIVQTGTTIARVVPKTGSGECLVTDILDTVRNNWPPYESKTS